MRQLPLAALFIVGMWRARVELFSASGLKSTRHITGITIAFLGFKYVYVRIFAAFSVRFYDNCMRGHT